MLAISAFVLAILVPIVGVLVSIIYARFALSSAAALQSAQCSKLTQDFRDFSTRHDTTLNAFAARIAACEKTSAAHLAAELAVLSGDVDRLATNSRKQFGKIFAELHHSGTLKRNVESQADVEDVPPVDPELAALLALQTPSVKPNGDAGG